LEELGPNACGTWTCDAFGECVVASDACSDRDEDGYGVGTSCTCSLDCDDNDADVTTSLVTPCCRTGSGTKTCTNGVWGVCSAGTPASAEACDGEDDDCDGVADNDIGDVSCGLGACRVTLPACVDGSVSTCLPLPPTSSVDSCNEVDDDCDGAVDEDCSGCLHVATDGDDVAAIASGGVSPFQNVQPAIDYAAAHPEGPTRVCVAAGPACGWDGYSFDGPTGADLRMRNGIDLLGNYESTSWTRCSDSTTGLRPRTGVGVLFDEDVVQPTVLDGFWISGSFAPPEPTDVTGVTVRGATGAMLSNLAIGYGLVTTTSYGVNVMNGGVATIARSQITGGDGTVRCAGVRSLGSRVHLIENCVTPLDRTTGHCVVASPHPWLAAQIRGCGGAGPSVALDLESSPGSVIEGSSFWGDIVLRGDATGTIVRANTILGEPSQRPDPTLGIEACDGAAPRIVDNETISGVNSVAISSLGDCHPRIEANREIFVSTAVGTPAIHCGSHGGVASQCVLVGNADIYSEFIQAPPPWQRTTVTIDCAGGACAKISRNRIFGTTPIPDSCNETCSVVATALVMEGAEALVDSNYISVLTGGLRSNLALVLTGLDARNSRALRVQNNLLRIAELNLGPIDVGPFSTLALKIDGGMIDVHSNTFEMPTTSVSVGGNRACVAGSVLLNGASTAVLRNNRMDKGDCGSPPPQGSQIGFFIEAGPAADPTVLENNGVWGTYLDEGSTVLTASQVNALVDMVVSGNVEGCTPTTPLSPGSPCTNAGTPVGAPLYDYEGQLRDAMPDIGHDEL
jgi:hypothetical protein